MTSLGRVSRWPPVIVTVFTIAGHACGSPPAAPGTGGTDGTPLDAAFAAAGQEPRFRSLVVARDGAVVREAFFNGGGPDSDEYVWSVTKSMLALTVGIALDRGCLRSLDQTIGDGAAFTLANGWGGQFILVVPGKRLVVTTAAQTTGLSGTATMAQWQRIFDILMLRIVPAF